MPAFYADWFARRLQEGYVLARNPYNPTRITRYRLDPKVVDAIGFCTKNPAPLFQHMRLLAPYGQYWFVTITPYGREIEKNVPEKARVIRSFQELSKMVGANRVAWRYDPIFVDGTYSLSYHIRAFQRMAEALEGYTHTVVISFLDLYEKTRRNFPEGQEVAKEQRLGLGEAIYQIARDTGMRVKACAEGKDLEPIGIDCTGCMTAAEWQQAAGCPLSMPNKATVREDCNCSLGADIGAYNSCGHLCKYCYANYDAKSVRRNMALHDPASPLLIGRVTPDDTIYDAEQRSWKNLQLTMDL